MKKTMILLLFVLIIASLQVIAQVGINNDGTAPASSAMLDVKSTSKGILFPRLTYEQRNAITSPAEGLVIYCTNCGSDNSGQLNIYCNGKWNSMTPCPFPSAPVGPYPGYIFHKTATSIRWIWNPVADATGYKFNTTNNLSTAIDIGSNTIYTEQSLNCNTTYSRYIWAYNACGVSTSLTLTASTAGCSPTTFFTENFESAAIGQVPPAGWVVEAVAGGNITSFELNGYYPACTPYNGSRMVEFNSYYYLNTENRLKYTTPIPFSGQSYIGIDFAWHVDPYYMSTNDYVAVEVSIDGVYWEQVDIVYRYNPLSQWKIMNMPVTDSFSGGLYIAFRFVSMYGNNCHLDFVHVTGY